MVNGRLSLAEIPLNTGSATLQLSLWSRNLLNNQYVYWRGGGSAIRVWGVCNEPRTYGTDATIRF